MILVLAEVVKNINIVAVINKEKSDRVGRNWFIFITFGVSGIQIYFNRVPFLAYPS